MTDRIREVLYPLALAVVLATFWVIGYAQAMESKVRRGWWPPLGPMVVAPEHASAGPAVDVPKS